MDCHGEKIFAIIIWHLSIHFHLPIKTGITFMERRHFLAISAASGLGVLTAGLKYHVVDSAQANPLPQPANDIPRTFVQPELPYALDALAPFLSKEQMSYHYGKHHAAYFNNLNKLVAGKPEAKHTLEELIVTKEGSIFNNAAQAWNHTFFWNCMSPTGGGKPSGKLAENINRDFGSFEAFSEKFTSTATALFGSGWVWLATDDKGMLELMPLSNADTPLKKGKTPLLVIDVWEHAYYLDYKNDRAKYVSAFMDRINWPFVENCYKKRRNVHLIESR